MGRTEQICDVPVDGGALEHTVEQMAITGIVPNLSTGSILFLFEIWLHPPDQNNPPFLSCSEPYSISAQRAPFSLSSIAIKVAWQGLGIRFGISLSSILGQALVGGNLDEHSDQRYQREGKMGKATES